ncbi:MAG: iron-sulfur cluster assembly accessory protein [Zymomonas mobilis subsp. pomaceae]|uniref:Iron-sulfur cluster assembly accessory protein n=1 Tax=Zymomonas mobilis subsp. pomaceae (strain ATCC 29192 / DSM 22645 / JCM 10191 / CCUG 17912 / NBRC 13757 / NCIMB 11200 / NRRL B-4491 / Barker I) TaxID=579138 RepID=F8ESA6_ZYMMT|nr:iron-sulfur cluster assembly accessory protein [Zymomonas mobilis]AEI37681.1 iron-sulfur cluster assembly accessory protein [Zymomonas mobilis subsp. pomaceae ATCC 29192]MDX5949048.1 iron-sulfur cluster assembly accessory protein [Zymomonas mobilis subsp. pomaceae]GEB88853.1 hypothetical protein ZMO02_04900 [Zymomonas mobilis subsp. pomaceae]
MAESSAILTLTPKAKKHVKDLLSEAPEGTIGLKLSTPKKGCSGLAYALDYTDKADPLDERIALDEGVIFIESASLLYLIGSVMDWVEDDFQAAFRFENPNATGMCGCGESFTV